MLRIFTDSGSSIKREETEALGVELIPLKILLGDEEFLDGVDLELDYFYDKLINDKIFPKTSLPALDDLKQKVDEYVKNGDEVLIITISSEISGTNNAINLLFSGYKGVRVFDSKMAVGGLRILVEEANKYRNESIDYVVDKLNDLLPRIKIMAIPETLDYLFKGGRLSKTEFLIGSLLKIKPVIGFKHGKVCVVAKRLGLNNAMRYLAESLVEFDCDENYQIIASYTYNKNNIDRVIDMISDKYKPLVKTYDNLDPAIACHWGPNAFGFVFVSKR